MTEETLGIAPERPGPATEHSRSAQVRRQDAVQFAYQLAPVIEDIMATGAETLQQIADGLNARGVRTRWGRRWFPTTVQRVLGRIKEPKA